MITFKNIKENDAINTYIKKADESLIMLGFTEHSFPHVCRVAEVAKNILNKLNYPERTAELAQIAAYLHDIGNVVNRVEHAQTGAVMAFRILDKLEMEPDEIATIITAIGNHDEGTAQPVNPVAAALILGDKSDVRYTRVRNKDITTFDIHDRVNFAVRKSDLIINDEHTEISLILTINTEICAVMDYFEIFLERMILCRKAAECLGLKFRLIINEQQLL